MTERKRLLLEQLAETMQKMDDVAKELSTPLGDQPPTYEYCLHAVKLAIHKYAHALIDYAVYKWRYETIGQPNTDMTEIYNTMTPAEKRIIDEWTNENEIAHSDDDPKERRTKWTANTTQPQ